MAACPDRERLEQHPWTRPDGPRPSRLDEIIVTVGSTGMAVAAISGLLLDNTIPGTDEERGLTSPGTSPTEVSEYTQSSSELYGRGERRGDGRGGDGGPGEGVR